MVLCEVLNPDGTPHETNHRSTLVEQLSPEVLEQECLFGFEQEYTMMDGQSVHGWPEKGYPAPQGPFYCGVVCRNPLAFMHVNVGSLIAGTGCEVDLLNQ